jgi:hypothetical protein
MLISWRKITHCCIHYIYSEKDYLGFNTFRRSRLFLGLLINLFVEGALEFTPESSILSKLKGSGSLWLWFSSDEESSILWTSFSESSNSWKVAGWIGAFSMVISWAWCDSSSFPVISCRSILKLFDSKAL